MYFDFANVLVFALVAAGFVVAMLVVGRLLFRTKDEAHGAGLETYECGEPTVGSAWIRFDIRFYTVALMFVVFDVEVALLFPWAVVFRTFAERGDGLLALVEALTFIVILFAGLAYVWVRGDIEWTPKEGQVPNTTDGEFSTRPALVPEPKTLAAAAAPGTSATAGEGTGA